MDKFKRGLEQELIDKLKAEPLFRNCLVPDIEKGSVFPAIRHNRIHFYYKGGRLFEYTKTGFRTHVKYASVLVGRDGGYIEEARLKDVRPISSFEEGYEAIKGNCEKHAGDEAKGVATIVSRLDPFHRLGEDPWIIPLDVEACFKKSNDDEDDIVKRIDIVFLEAESKKLRFCEAKSFGNKELWSRPGTKPRVTQQLENYSMEIDKRSDEIVEAYVAHVKALEALFGWVLPEPNGIDRIPLFLFVFNFDSNQRHGRLKELLLKDGSLKGYHSYQCGDLKKMELKNMWKNVKKY